MKTITDNQIKRAVIYCRVSTKEQVEEGNSLVSQERICKEYALQNHYIVERIFIEQGESAKTVDRTELQKLLTFCSDRKNRINAVITYKIDRISRNMDGYSEIRILLKRYGVEIKSTSEFFENTPAGRFMENIIANVAQFDNDVRTERSVGGMKEAVREGRVIWMAPLGYTNQKTNGKTNLVQNEKAPIVLETFERIAQSLKNSEEIRLMMSKKGLVNKNGKPLSKAHFYRMLRNELYMGWIARMGMRVKGSYFPIIPQELFDFVQKVLVRRKNQLSNYNKKNPDFPLRNFVTHSSGEPITGAWCKGRTAHYPYYWFRKTKISLRKEILEQSFCEYLNHFKLNATDIHILICCVALHVIDKNKNITFKNQEYQNKLIELKDFKSKLIFKNVAGIINDNDLKEQIEKIDKSIYEVEEMIVISPERNKETFLNALATVKSYLMSPADVWLKSPYEIRVKLQWFNFPQGIIFDGKICRTEEIASIYKVKSPFFTIQSPMVPHAFSKLNQQAGIKKSRKWLNLLPRNESNISLFWERVYIDIIKLAETLKSTSINPL